MEIFETSQSSRHPEDDVDKTSHRHHKAKTTSTRPRGRSLRTDGRQPSSNHPSRTTNKIVSGCRAKKYIHRSATVQGECGPWVSERRRVVSCLPVITITIESLNSKFHIFFSSLFGAGVVPKQGDHKVQGQDTYLFTLDDLIQNKVLGDFCEKQVTTRERHKQGHHPDTPSGDAHHLCHTEEQGDFNQV